MKILTFNFEDQSRSRSFLQARPQLSSDKLIRTLGSATLTLVSTPTEQLMVPSFHFDQREMIVAQVISWECEDQNITFPDSLKYSLEGQQDGTSGYQTDIVYFLPTFLRHHALTSAISHLENNRNSELGILQLRYQ